MMLFQKEKTVKIIFFLLYLWQKLNGWSARKKCRFRVCKFIDKLNDAQFGSIYDYVQCKGCELWWQIMRVLIVKIRLIESCYCLLVLLLLWLYWIHKVYLICANWKCLNANIFCIDYILMYSLCIYIFVPPSLF